MPEYRLFFIEPTPKHVREIVNFAAVDDADALGCARARSNGRMWELWRDERLVFTVAVPVAPLAVASSR